MNIIDGNLGQGPGILYPTSHVCVWEKVTRKGVGHLAAAILLLLWNKGLSLYWRSVSSSVRRLGSIGGKGRKFGNDMHRSSLISGVIRSTGPPALQGAQIRDYNFPVDCSGTTESLAIPVYQVTINRYKNGFPSPFWINYMHPPIPHLWPWIH